MKKSFVLLLLAVCLLCVCHPVIAFAGSTESESSAAGSTEQLNISYYVNDMGELLTWDEDWALEEKAADISDKYNCGVYVLTITDSMQGSADIFDFAEWFYTTYGLGKGEDKSAAVLVVNASSREFATFFNGDTATYAFNSYGQEKLEDYFLSDLHDSEWNEAFDGFITGCGEYLQLAAEGKPVRKSPAGMIAICIGISFGISLIICLLLRSRMKSVHIGTGAADYSAAGLTITGKNDRFTHRTETRTRIERESSSGTSSSARTGSSGGSGRSGKF